MSTFLNICLWALVVATRLAHTAPTSEFSKDNPFCSVFDTDAEFSDFTYTSSFSSTSDDERHSKPGATIDKSPGLGIEFESSKVIFSNRLNTQCTQKGYLMRKGRQISDFIADDKSWVLTSDTTLNNFDHETHVGHLTGEFIMDGRIVKLGKGRAIAVAQYVTNFWTKVGSEIKILGPRETPTPECDDWVVGQDPDKGHPSEMREDLSWTTQVTVSMPFEAIDKLFEMLLKNEEHRLLPIPSQKKKHMVWVSEEFFTGISGGLDGSDPEIRGFFSLLLSYAKNAQKNNPAESPKMLTSIMPRTNFITMYKKIKDKMNGADLYDVTKQLACRTYQEEEDNKGKSTWRVVLDESKSTSEGSQKWCTLEKPDKKGKVQRYSPTTRMDKEEFQLEKGNLKVSQWIRSIEKGETDDLETADAKIDAQIGALGDKMEWVFGTKKEAALFEFRDIGQIRMSRFSKWVKEIQEDVLKLHHEFSHA